jgi:tRNA (adenine22-N1)-methyltransferase
MTALPLDTRLQAVADMVRPGSRVADIGTDHGYVVAHLLSVGKCPSAIAADLATGPLEAARKNLAPYGNRVRLMLSDGLKAIQPDTVDDIVIAGMGGELIARILSEAEGFRRAGLRFILQPMSRISLLRQRLCAMGFEILQERPVIAAGRPYTVMGCAYTGQCHIADPAFCYLGKIPLPPDEAGRRLLSQSRTHLHNRLRGLRDDPAAAAEIEAALMALEAVLEGP